MWKQLVISHVGGVVECQEALFHEPGVKVTRAIEGGETMIGHHDDACVRRRSVERLTYRPIQLPIEIQQFTFELSPEHMGVLIDAGKVIKQQALPEMIELITKH